MNDGTRTRDNWNHNPGLYQLSYVHHIPMGCPIVLAKIHNISVSQKKPPKNVVGVRIRIVLEETVVRIIIYKLLGIME